MAPSENAVRALDQVKMGLSMLYGAEYFTEEEWIQLDGLIHKGKYVFTRGPPKHLLDGSPLMMSADYNDQSNGNHDFNEIDALEPLQNAKPALGEDTSAHSSTDPESPVSSPGTPNETSAEEDNTVTLSPKTEVAPMFDFPQEMKAVGTFKPISEKQAYPSSASSPEEQTSASPSSSEDRNTYSTQPTNHSVDSSLSRSPAPTTDSLTYSNIASIASPTPSHPPLDILAKEWAYKHGREPKNLNDFYQPNNPQHQRLASRSISRASFHSGTTSTAHTGPPTVLSTSKFAATNKGNNGPVPQLDVAAGTVLVAKSSCEGKGIRIQVRAGDHIRIIKHVSGIMHIGENITSKQRGQIPESIFRVDPAAAASMRRSSVSTNIHSGLDRMEEIGASEWIRDDASTIGSVKPKPITQMQGLSASRYSEPVDNSSQNARSAILEQEKASILKGEFDKLLEERFEKFLKDREDSSNANAATAASATGSNQTPLGQRGSVSSAGKTETCWWWATPNKECRYTAEECVNLHDWAPNSALKKGKPSWGDVASRLSPPEESATKPKPDSKGRLLTCWYWANANCNNTADTCKYLHEHTGTVAHKPGNKFGRWGTTAWERVLGNGAVEGEESERGELVLEEVREGMNGGEGWGVSPDVYKPPHVKAMEELREREQQMAQGWW